jgi:hypothetical protein
MAEFVTCPACGVRVQTSEALLGKAVRCTACQQRFVADPDPPAPARLDSPAAVPPARRPGPPPPDDLRDEAGLPFCPGCGRRVGWDVLCCPYCREELEPEAPFGRRPPPLVRRDWLPHRGRTIVVLGNISMALGGLALCTGGVAALGSVPLGVTAWIMAQQDLHQIREGVMDPQGRSDTQAGRVGGILGVALGLIFGIFYIVIYLGAWP